MKLPIRLRLADLTAIFLAVCLAMTSLTMAVARGQARVAGEVVVCTGYGVTTLQVDANGRPTGAAHLCPDMVLGMMAALDSWPPALIRPESIGSVAFFAQPSYIVSRDGPMMRARSPPVWI